ncbi:MAG: cupin domain-containing protein [Pirellulales bacterium]|nr:cupin domain-containing protein [Pirellulales bacterium]
MNNSADEWISQLELIKHPEGGWYREFYRAAESIPGTALPDRFTGNRSFSTAIYYLLKNDEISSFHRIKQDELWHFYDGSSLTIHMIDASGEYSMVLLGRSVADGLSLAAVVDAGCLFGATVDDPAGYALLGCTVAPGFDFEDFELPDRETLLRQYPQHDDVIRRLTK